MAGGSHLFKKQEQIGESRKHKRCIVPDVACIVNSRLGDNGHLIVSVGAAMADLMLKTGPSHLLTLTYYKALNPEAK